MKLVKYLFCVVLLHATGRAAEPETLFVSLGSNCNVASALRELGLRKAAYPLDWLLSLDGEKVIYGVIDSFSKFTDRRHVNQKMHPKKRGVFVQRAYHLQFAHEKLGSEKLFQEFKDKYDRRAARFAQIENYAGKVCFIRRNWPRSNGKKYVFRNRENVEISADYAKRLFLALKERFPKVDLDLIIINVVDGKKNREQQIHKNVCMESGDSLSNVFQRILPRYFSANAIALMPVLKTIDCLECNDLFCGCDDLD